MEFLLPFLPTIEKYLLVIGLLVAACLYERHEGAQAERIKQEAKQHKAEVSWQAKIDAAEKKQATTVADYQAQVKKAQDDYQAAQSTIVAQAYTAGGKCQSVSQFVRQRPQASNQVPLAASPSGGRVETASGDLTLSVAVLLA